MAVARQLEAEFELIGDSPTSYTLPPNMRALPHQDRSGIADALAQAHALVLLSEWNETFGLVVAEAASVGVASIVSKFSGIAAVLPPGASWVVDPFDLSGVFAAFREASDPEEALRRGAAAQKWFSACESLTQRGHALALQQVYHPSQDSRGDR